MECQSSDSKKLFKVFDASKGKRARKKRGGHDDSISLATDESNSGCQGSVLRVASAKASLQDVPTSLTIAVEGHADDAKRNRDSSPSVSHSPGRDDRRACHSPRRHRRSTRKGLSLALKPGLVSTPRSSSPHQGTDGIIESIPPDQDSFIYALLKEEIKRDKKRHRHLRRHEERRGDHDREASVSREHRHHHRRHRDDYASKDRTRDRSKKDVVIDQTALFETFAKLCAQLNEKNAAIYNQVQVPRILSHKSLQCEVISKCDQYDVDDHPKRLRSIDQSRDNVSKTRSHDNFRDKVYCHEKIPNPREKPDKCMCCHRKDGNQYSSKENVTKSRMRKEDDERYTSYPPDYFARNSMDNAYRSRTLVTREHRDYDREYAREKHYEKDKRKYDDQKTSRSYEVNRDGYPDDEKCFHRTTRSDNVKENHYDEREKYYDDKKDQLDARDRFTSNRRIKRNIDRCERNSVVSRDEEYRDRDRYSERERDSGLSIADGETSTISGKTNYLRVVKQEIAEQRETMDKMMKLWKELMRCFKGMSATQGQSKSVQDTGANVQESAAAQLRLWRECMRRYETVARDVGDTDARLMEEINKQRSEMSEMASMWQECLQRYREISSDFNNLKQQVTITKNQQYVAPAETPTRMPAAPLTCAEGEGSVPPAPFRLPSHYPQMGPVPSGYGGGSPLRPRASAPPAWWWCGEAGAQRSPRRRSSPESRGSRDRRRRHKDRDRDDSRYKEKTSKPNGARSEHRHRKR